MPWYNDLRPQSDYKKKDYALIFPEMTTEEKKRTITNLLALRQGLLNPENHRRLKADLEEISRMLAGLIKGIDN